MPAVHSPPRPPAVQTDRYRRARRIVTVALLAACLTPALRLAQSQALPLFSRETGESCNRCHTTVPRLNRHGAWFAQNGYREGPDGIALVVLLKLQLAQRMQPLALHDHHDRPSCRPAVLSQPAVPLPPHPPGVDL